MRITHAWDVDRELAADFGRKYGAVIVDDYWDMVGKVDGIILDDFLSCLHFRQLARPYLEAGVPMYINRPFAFNLGHAREILDLAAKYDTPILTGSSFEFAPEVEHIRRQVDECEPLSGYCAANSMSDYATHGVHGVFFMRACIDDPVRQVSYQTRDWRVPNGILTFEHEPENGGKPYYGCVQETTGVWGWIRAFGQRGFEEKVHAAGPSGCPWCSRCRSCSRPGRCRKPTNRSTPRRRCFWPASSRTSTAAAPRWTSTTSATGRRHCYAPTRTRTGFFA